MLCSDLFWCNEYLVCACNVFVKRIYAHQVFIKCLASTSRTLSMNDLKYTVLQMFCSVLFCSVLGPMHLFMKTQIIHRLTNEKHLSVSPFLAPFPQDGDRINCVAFFLERIQQFGRWGSRCYPHGQRGLGNISSLMTMAKILTLLHFH